MKLSTRGRYGLMAMHQLMLCDGDGPTPLRQIAEAENLSEPYLEQLFSSLKRNGLVKSIRGPQGGYILARPPEDIPIGEILRALEGDLSINQCCNDIEHNECSRLEDCPTKDVLTQLQERIDNVIDSVTLADMLKTKGGEHGTLNLHG